MFKEDGSPIQGDTLEDKETSLKEEIHMRGLEVEDQLRERDVESGTPCMHYILRAGNEKFICAIYERYLGAIYFPFNKRYAFGK